VHDDYRWVVVENGVPFNHYWRDYKQSLSTWINAGWNDGDPSLYSCVGHPVQGALTSYIQIQNDPHGEKLELSNTKAYWRRRLEATLWNAVYSTLWTAGATGEEDRNSFKEAQIWTAGFSVGKVLTEQTGKGWLRGSLEYGFNLIPIFVTFRNQTVHGGGFEPVFFR